MFYKSFAFTFFCLFSFSSHALKLRDFDQLQIQIGTWLENYAQVQTTPEGDVNDGFAFTPLISAGLTYKYKPQIQIIPEVGWVFQRTQENVSKNIFLFRNDFAYVPKDWFKLRAGSSLIITSISGDGGEETLNNGTTTESYFIPEQRRNAFNQTLDFGIEFLHKNASLRFQTYFYAWNDSDERMYTHAMSFNYFIPVKSL